MPKTLPYATVALLVPLLAAIPPAQATHDPNDFFTLEAAFPGYVWNDIHGNSTTNVWAVGQNGALSAIARRTGAGWGLVSSPTIGPLCSVWAHATRAYAAPCQGGLEGVLKWDGLAWTSQSDGPEFESRSVTGALGEGAIFAGTTSAAAGLPQLAAFKVNDGIGFGSMVTCSPSTPGAITSVYQSTPGGGPTVYGWVDTPGTPVEISGGGYSACPVVSAGFFPGVPTDIWAASGSASDTVTVGLSGVILSGVGVGQTVASSPTTQNLHGVHGTSLSNLWAVGDQGTIIHGTSPTAWTLEPTPTTSALTGVYFFSAAEGWITSATGDILKLQVNPGVALPVLTGLQWDPNDMFVTASQAQLCSDPVSLGINVEPSLGAGGLVAYVINSDTGIVVESFSQASFFSLSSKHFHQNRFYPTGEYTFLVTADVSGLLTPDNYAAATFSVPSCIPTNEDILPILLHHFNQTNTYVNDTQDFLTLHFNQTNQYINDTSVVCEGCNVTMDLGNLTQLVLLHFNQTNSYINGTNQTINVVVEAFDESLAAFLWLAVVAVAYAFTRAPNGAGAFPAILLFLASIALGVAAFSGDAVMSIVAIGVGLVGLFLSTHTHSTGGE